MSSFHRITGMLALGLGAMGLNPVAFGQLPPAQPGSSPVLQAGCGPTNCRPNCAPSYAMPCQPVPSTPLEDPLATDQPLPPDIDTTAVSSSFGAASGDMGAPHMIGDFGGGQIVNNIDIFGSVTDYSAGSVRNFKASEFQSTVPVNRVYTAYSYFNDVSGAVGGGGSGAQLSRFLFGFENLIGDNDTSFGMRIPLWLADSGSDGTGGGILTDAPSIETGDFGDVTFILKRAISRDRSYGDIVTVGCAWTIPTGPATVGGLPELANVNTGLNPINHNGSIQPLVAGIYNLGQNWFTQYFVSTDIPFDSDDAIFLFGDIGLAQNLVTGRSSGLTRIVPTVELHVLTPLNNRTIPTGAMFAGMPITLNNVDQVNITTGVTFEINRSRTIALGLVSPIGNSISFDWEFQVQVNLLGGLGQY